MANPNNNSDEKTRILLIDDEPNILRTFRFCLEDVGHRVTTASDAALRRAAGCSFGAAASVSRTSNSRWRLSGFRREGQSRCAVTQPRAGTG